jgi:hypothetical protein
MKLTLTIPGIRKLPEGMTKEDFLATLIRGVGTRVADYDYGRNDDADMKKDKTVRDLLGGATISRG